MQRESSPQSGLVDVNYPERSTGQGNCRQSVVCHRDMARSRYLGTEQVTDGDRVPKRGDLERI